ncbi:ABC transporter ATP-binding protein [Echinicola jeungdonensis]|uniref:Polysaccharide ABC transporter ATP-binding protein n=1 Tax=Echinicola jeungdonensis TaxID=709343 RepID=A0ABV5J4C5_9BACT|nr:ABC transporter ATP-binding protein [Echinicola jeungdonensis]MDN3667882.1 ABC transporter ATP-binding protein [Echinicola jeungdonensis]
MRNDEVLIKVEGVSKKFCKSLKRSLWYGLGDIFRSVLGIKNPEILRKDEFWAVKDVSFEVRRGECLGLIGHNGAGKSTLLKMLNGLIRPDEGRIEMRGKVGALIELGAGFNPVLTGRENVYNNGAILGFSKAEIDYKFDDIVNFAEMEEFVDMPVQNYSSGMKVRLGFAIAAQLEPDVLILDEVLAVGDSDFRVKCFNHIYKVISKSAVVFVSHSIPQLTRICDKLGLLEKGNLLKYGNGVGDIIFYYTKALKQEKHTKTNEIQNILIKKFWIKETDNPVGKELTFGKSYFIQFELDLCGKAIYNDLKILITVNDATENNVLQLIENIEFTSGKLNLYKFEFQNANFNAGRYFITASILEGDKGKFLSVQRNITFFDVKNYLPGYASVFLIPHKITHEIKK